MDLLQAQGGGVTLVVEEGRFLKVAAATGPLAPTVAASSRWTSRCSAGW
ncbi:MAG: hypothetical protein ACREMG_12835 [Gemmatimonadales bacterium]